MALRRSVGATGRTIVCVRMLGGAEGAARRGATARIRGSHVKRVSDLFCRPQRRAASARPHGRPRRPHHLHRSGCATASSRPECADSKRASAIAKAEDELKAKPQEGRKDTQARKIQVRIRRACEYLTSFTQPAALQGVEPRIVSFERAAAQSGARLSPLCITRCSSPR